MRLVFLRILTLSLVAGQLASDAQTANLFEGKHLIVVLADVSVVSFLNTYSDLLD